jgi:hypothetical protein
VLDQADFDDLLDMCYGLFNIGDGQRMAKADLDNIRAAKHIPLMARGTKTEIIFQKFDIGTNKASFIVRGAGKRIARQMGFTSDSASN